METRLATVDDAELISAHRRAMFAEMRGTSTDVLNQLKRKNVEWLRKMIPASRYLGWITCENGTPVASAGLLLLDWPPHPFDPGGELRAYLLNVYVDPGYRKRGLAQALVAECMQEARRRGIRVVTLHASDAGRPLYEKSGFRATNEMMHVDP